MLRLLVFLHEVKVSTFIAAAQLLKAENATCHILVKLKWRTINTFLSVYLKLYLTAVNWLIGLANLSNSLGRLEKQI